MLPIIQSLWVGDPLSNLEKLCVQSFMDNGHEFHLYVYDDVQGIPNGVMVKDGNEILPYSEITAGTLQHWSSLSDYFRYALLYKKGGWWVDMDTICIKPFDFDEDIILSDKDSGSGWFPNSPLRFPPEHPLMKTMCNLCHKRIRMKGVGRVEMGGPPILTKQIRQSNLQHYALPRMRFFLPHENEFSYFDNAYRDGLHFPANTHALHIYNSILTRTGFDKDAQYDTESLFEQLKARYNIPQIPGARRVTTDQVAELQHTKIRRHYKATRRRKRREKMWVVIALLSLIALVACLILW